MVPTVLKTDDHDEPIKNILKLLTVPTPEKLLYLSYNSLTMWLYYRVMRPKDADRTANSVDPDPTAPLGLHCLQRPVHPKTKYHYRKFPKYLDTPKICCNHSKI